jgi:hypothetical protein
MPISATDVSVAVNGDIRWTGGATPNYTVLELHRFLQDLADDAQASGNDLVDITSSTPSVRSTDNIITLNSPYNIDDTMAEHLYAGSITQAGGDTVYSGLRVLGAVNTAATQLMVVQDGDLYQFTTTDTAPFWGTQATGGYNGNAAAGVLMRVLIKTRENGADFDNKRVRVQARHYVGTIGDTFDFFNVQLGTGESVAAIGTTPDGQNTTAQATVTAYADVLNSGGTANAPTGGYQLIDLGDGSGNQPYYSQWTFGAQGDGLKALWEYTKDLTRTGSTKTVDTIIGEFFLGVTHEVAFDGQTVNFAERDEIAWGTTITYNTLVSGPFTAGNVVTIGSNGASGRVMFDDGTDTLVVALDDTSITLLDNDVITEFPGVSQVATSTTAAINVTIADNDKQGGSGIALAVNDGGATGTLWIQLQSGVAPVDNLPLYSVDTPTADGTVNGAPVSRTVPKIFTGSYTGSYIGAYGVGIDPNDLTATDTVQDLDGDTNTPPNNVTFTVTGLVSGEDRVLVGPRSGSALDKAQDTHSALLTDGTSATVVMTTAIPTDTPATSAATATRLRIEDDNGVYVSIPYQSYTGSTYTLTGQGTGFFEGSDNSNSAALNDVFIAYIDELASASTSSFTTIFLSTRDLFVRVRDGGATPIVTFEGTASQLTSTGGTIAAIRNSDA